MKKTTFTSLIILIFSVIVGGCSANQTNQPENKDAPENVIVEEQGLIVDKKIINNQSYRILVITNISQDELKKHSVDELVNNARKELSAAWYKIDQGTYDKLKSGQKVEVTFDNKQEQADSNPPIRVAMEVKILEDAK